MANNQISIVLVDNQPLFSIAMSDLLRKEIGFSTMIKSCLSEIVTDFDILFFSLDAAGNTRPKKQLQIFIKQFPNTKVLLITSDCSRLNIQGLLDLGVKGIVFRTEAPEIFTTAIRLVSSGKYYLCHPDIINQASFALYTTQPDITLREKEILTLLIKGKTDKEIALALNLANQTVRNRLHEIYGKLNVGSRTEAILQLSGSKTHLTET